MKHARVVCCKIAVGESVVVPDGAVVDVQVILILAAHLQAVVHIAACVCWLFPLDAGQLVLDVLDIPQHPARLARDTAHLNGRTLEEIDTF